MPTRIKMGLMDQLVISISMPLEAGSQPAEGESQFSNNQIPAFRDIPDESWFDQSY
jgi:hypothetical protein